MSVDVGAGGLGWMWLSHASAGEWGVAAAACGVSETVVRARVMQLARRLGIEHVGCDDAVVAAMVLPVFAAGQPPVPELWESLASGEHDLADSAHQAAAGRFDLASALLAGHGMSADAEQLYRAALDVLHRIGHALDDPQPVAVFGQLDHALLDPNVLDYWYHALQPPSHLASLPDRDLGPLHDGAHDTLFTCMPGDAALDAADWTSATGPGEAIPADAWDTTARDPRRAMDAAAQRTDGLDGPEEFDGAANTTAVTAVPAPPAGKRKRKRANSTPLVPVHAPRPRSRPSRGQHSDETILAGIRDTPEDTGINIAAQHISMETCGLASWLQYRSSQLGLDQATAVDVLRYIRANLDTVSLALVGKRAAALSCETPCPAFLTKRDVQVVATLLHYPDMTYVDIARLCDQSHQKMGQWVQGAGTRLGFDGKATDVMAYVRDADNRSLVLQLAGLTDTTIPHNLLRVAERQPLSERDQQVIATLLHHSDKSYRTIAVLYHYPVTTMEAWLEGLGTRLDTKVPRPKVVAYVRKDDNRARVLQLAGLTDTTISQNLLRVAERQPLSERDQQVIATFLHHPDWTLSNIASVYRYDRRTLALWLAEASHKLGVTGRTDSLVIYIRDARNRERVLWLAGLTDTSIPQNLIPNGIR
ncbi:hypothetical protein [Streptomyces sp. NPDC051014]|uniref:hypothetical protein n=1 Tax=Streptomyces sp. NPDC051014 TaxID=3155751 RepID=UPI0033DAF127